MLPITSAELTVEPWLKMAQKGYVDASNYVLDIPFWKVFAVWFSSHLILIVFMLITNCKTFCLRKAEENITLMEIIVEKYPLQFIHKNAGK
jgi:uncharacterized membrane protein (UPF0182 family)